MHDATNYVGFTRALVWDDTNWGRDCMKRTPFSGLWRHPAFRLFWAGQTISVFGDQVSALALPLVAVFTLQASAVQLGLLNAAGRAPLFLFGLFAGVWVDRVRRRPLLIGADLGRSLLLGSIPLVAWLGWLDMPYLYGVAVLVGTLAVCFNTAVLAGWLIRRGFLAHWSCECQDSMPDEPTSQHSGKCANVPPPRCYRDAEGTVSR